MTKPFLMIDVDGPLNPYASSNNSLRKGEVFHCYKLLGFKVWLNRWHGEELLKLTDVFDLVWATTWEHDANALIGPRIGLPELPVIEFKKDCPPHPPAPGLHWKTAVIAAYSMAHRRPFSWVDDEVGVRDSVYFMKCGQYPHLALRVSPITGLTAEHFEKLRAWAEEVIHDEAA